MRQRRWDVVARDARRWPLALVVALALAGCGQARGAAPPAPAFTRGIPPQTTMPGATVSVATEPPATPATTPIAQDDTTDGATPGSEPPADPEGDVGDSDVAAAEPDTPDPHAMVIVDDTGIAVPNESGWRAFDQALSRRLIPADVSASVAVLIDGELIHQAAYGERVAGSGDATAVTDRFRIASISKSITAIVTMQMVERGELTLDEPVGQILLDYLGVVPSDADAPALTVRQLLRHTSGFGKYQTVFFGNGAVSYGDAVRIGMSGSVSSGAGFSYSNMNFAVLTVLIEAVTGRTYEQVVRDRLLTPLGFTDMRLASTYEVGPDEVSHDPRPGRNYMEVLGGAGAWNATPSEVAMIYNSIDPETGGWKALTPESMALMRSGVPTSSPTSTYGLGVFNYPGDAWGHTGTIERAHSMVLVQPDGVTWAISVAGESPSSTGTLRSIMGSALAAGFS